MYISVKDAAVKFNISKRRVQILCEKGRISGAKISEGVWLIPDNAQKPEDARYKSTAVNKQNETHDNTKELIGLAEVCEILSISEATAKNWLRLGKLTTEGKGNLFKKEYIINLLKTITDGDDSRLKSRRNKKNVSGKSLYDDYIESHENKKVIREILDSGIEIDDTDLRIIVANFAVQLFYQSRKIKYESGSVIFDYFNSAPKDSAFYALITELLGSGNALKSISAAANAILEYKIIFYADEDTLGFIYISLRDINRRKLTGAYYTPYKIVKQLLDDLDNYTDLRNLTVCDPCCGSGNFFIGLIQKGAKADNLYGQDADEISLNIAKINIAILCEELKTERLRNNFICGDTLKSSFEKKFDVVLGNPPWGYEFSKDELSYIKKHYVTAEGRSCESYDVFTERALGMLKQNSMLAFVLPEAIFTVASHQNIRMLMREKCSFKFVSYLGNVFSGVQCPSLILGASLSKQGTALGCRVKSADIDFIIDTERDFDGKTFNFNISNEEYACMTAIENIDCPVYLEDNAIFALGIVTGNNKKYIKDIKDDSCEAILKGSDITRYGINRGRYFIKFEPEKFQQVAPKEYYRAEEKLLYRFICDVPVFAYDNKQTLTLNSCNILIPKIKGLELKYILAVLNSRIAAFYIMKKYNSVKMLRSHLEKFPIPSADKKAQAKIINKVERITNVAEDISGLYEDLDSSVMNLYKLNSRQREVISYALKDKNMFF